MTGHAWRRQSRQEWTDRGRTQGGGYEVVVQTVNSNGGHVMPTMSSDECKGAQAQKDNGWGVLRSFVRSTSSCTRIIQRK